MTAVLYRAADIGLRLGVALLRAAPRANHGEAVPAPETGSEGISRGVYVYVAVRLRRRPGLSCARRVAYARARS